MRIFRIIRNLGPGLLFAGAAIGVSHLVQATRAGASFGLQLAVVIVLIHIIKYPFFEYGHRYAAATGEFANPLANPSGGDLSDSNDISNA